MGRSDSQSVVTDIPALTQPVEESVLPPIEYGELTRLLHRLHHLHANSGAPEPHDIFFAAAVDSVGPEAERCWQDTMQASNRWTHPELQHALTP